MGILNDINSTIKETDKFIYNELADKLTRSVIYLSNVTAIRGKKYPYLRIDNAREPIKLHGKGVYFFVTPGNIAHTPSYKLITYLPEWLRFKVKYNSYANKYGYKPIVKIVYNRDYYGTLLFSDGKDSKEFENCIVQLYNYNTGWVF